MAASGPVFNSSTQKIQSIFNDTALKIQSLFCKDTESSGNGDNPSPNPNPSPSTSTTTPSTGAAEIIPILQTFLLDIQMCHTQVFNGIVNSVSARVPLLQEDIRQPEVTAKWQTSENPSGGANTSNASPLWSFVANESISAQQTVSWPMEREYVRSHSNGYPSAPPSYSTASQETRRHWGSRSPIHENKSSYTSLATRDNYDEFINHYTKEYSRYNNTFVADSSEDENENEDAWKSLSDYVKPVDANPNSASEPTSDPNSMQCCARLSKFMKYHIIDYPEDFLDAYPPDVYIEQGCVFGKPCSNWVDINDTAAGIHFCHEHQFDIDIEDIRQPRPSTDTHPNDDVDIKFANEGYFNAEDQGIDYYGMDGLARDLAREPRDLAREPRDLAREPSGFTEGHQCCARLNKYRKHEISQEQPGFLETYPPNVYIENGYVFGTACQNMYSDDSAKAGIKYCMVHQSDPYVENICEPRGILNRPTTNSSNPKSGVEEAEMLGLIDINLNLSKGGSAQTKDKNSGYTWNKYNTDFNYLC
jgi:hypothetical protein